MTALMALVAVIASGVAAGGLLNVGIAQVPTFRALPPGSYLQTKQLLHTYTNNYLPWAVRISLPAGIALAVLRPDVLGRSLAIGGVVHLIVVAAISERFNQPMNRRIQSWSPDSPPPELDEVRARWAKFNLIRTINAAVALGLFAACAVLPV